MTTDSEDDRSPSSSADESGDDQEHGDMAEHRDKNTSTQNGNKSSSNAKDPMRPRRKKARRACFACQRAHLTCGDERPCQRCIKRGLQDQCQDGVRKKAKYLHDAPNEALMPGAANIYTQNNGISRNLALRSEDSPQQQTPGDPYFQQQGGQAYNVYQQNKSMPPPMLQDAGIHQNSFTQQSPLSSPFTMPSSHGMQTSNMTSPAQGTPGLQNTWNGQMFEANDPALFNFDIASMNFGNHYGALEFGMLGHMATGAGETPPSDTHNHGSVNAGGPNFPVTRFSNSPGNGPYGYGDAIVSDWSNDQNLFNQQYRHQQQPSAFTIETNPGSFTSPDSNASPQALANMKLEDSPNMGNHHLRPGSGHVLANQSRNIPARQPHPKITTPNLKASALPVKRSGRPRNPSHIYTSVTTPYSYTAGFHSLIAYLQSRFASSPQKTLQIAKALASIRPSFIATTKTLNRDDLIFMEKCFQRTLWEYEGFIEGIGTPTIIARRTGEIAAVGKEFCILTGWKKDVLLGKEPNLNMNRGASAATSGANTLGSKTSGVNTPAQRNAPGYSDPVDGARTPGRPQPVFLAEILDDDSVVDFYEDFSRLAFGDSRGSVTGKGKLLKYKTKDDLPFAKNNGSVKTANGESGSQEQFGKEGKVECTYCWTVKRDVFDIPMLIVINFLPVI